jgi:hypothetical protein
MGADASSLQMIEFEGKDCYTQWTFADVQAAWGRYEGLQAFPPLTLTPREFYTVFNDFSVIRNGTFLCLPQNAFEAFVPSQEGSSHAVFAAEPFIMLALFCSGEFKEKARFVFDIFDFNKDESLSKDEILIQIKTINRAMQVLSETTSSFQKFQLIQYLV